MPFDLLLLPLLGGYVFVSRFNLLRFEAKRLNGQRLVMLSALVGVVALAVSYIIVKFIILWAQPVYLFWKSVFPHRDFGPAIGAFLLGSTTWWPLNKIWGDKKSIDSVISKWNDRLEMILERALCETKKVMIDLKGGKTYIGLVVSPCNPEYDRKYISLLPLLSGYRNKDTHELCLTTDYTSVYNIILEQGLDADNNRKRVDNFEIVILASEILAVHIFDDDAYRFFHNS
jgi:hypothetical protein